MGVDLRKVYCDSQYTRMGGYLRKVRFERLAARLAFVRSLTRMGSVCLHFAGVKNNLWHLNGVIYYVIDPSNTRTRRCEGDCFFSSTDQNVSSTFFLLRLWNGAIVLELDPFKEIVVCHF